MRWLIPLLVTVSVTLLAQPMSLGGSGSKALLTVPMVGTGTWEDPKRPAFVRESGVAFRYQVSDDGMMAIVEATPRNLAEMAKLEASVKTEPRARLYRPEKDRYSDVITAIKALKKDFDPASFTRPGPPIAITPVPVPIQGK